MCFQLLLFHYVRWDFSLSSGWGLLCTKLRSLVRTGKCRYAHLFLGGFKVWFSIRGSLFCGLFSGSSVIDLGVFEGQFRMWYHPEKMISSEEVTYYRYVHQTEKFGAHQQMPVRPPFFWRVHNGNSFLEESHYGPIFGKLRFSSSVLSSTDVAISRVFMTCEGSSTCIGVRDSSHVWKFQVPGF